ncbi:MAG: putative type 4 fimbrial biogenesis PilW-related protein transmembrane [Candidatus Gallionella acididurans]|uniref:Putative type 4 fimbrial biogenesis PilW-related protein transmembrane n=1 Tax=Candidatus Gallionella acididurans TaxID=1796491 RepID=A0A139BPV9_9PROT|nr:MAG: putative type 4 fimbrial biogenesis PilW-related protein transmembrane [Candidatus Gallionella acididurans]
MKHSADKQTHLRSRFQGGLSLIELMVSITIGLLILVALSSMFINQSKTRVELDKSNRMIDNGRYAMELLTNNLSMAGYYSQYAPVGVPTTLYDPCDIASLTNPATNPDILELNVQGYNAANSTSLISSLPCGSAYVTTGGLTYTAGSPASVSPGSDILAIRRASTAISASATSGITYLQVSMCPTDVPGPPNNYQIAVAPASFSSMHKMDCATAANLRPFMVLTYFVSPSDNVNNGVGDGIPTLKQIDQYGNVTSLVEGIEYLQFDYGIDDTGDGEADRYVDCSTCTLADWSNVVSVRINLIARNQQMTAGWSDSKTYSLGLDGTAGPFNDAYKRHAFTQLVRLVNPSGRREQP